MTVSKPNFYETQGGGTTGRRSWPRKPLRQVVARRELIARLDVVNVFDEVYELRDGSGIGAPQFGQRRGLYGGLTLAF